MNFSTSKCLPVETGGGGGGAGLGGARGVGGGSVDPAIGLGSVSVRLRAAEEDTVHWPLSMHTIVTPTVSLHKPILPSQSCLSVYAFAMLRGAMLC